MFKGIKNKGFIFSVACAMLAAVIICVCAISCSGGKLKFKTTFYFVCYRITDNSISASSLSATVSSYGGAGYILNHNENYYITVSCYYKQAEAETVCNSLKKRDLDCSVLQIETETYKLKSNAAKNNSQLYLGNLNTLNSLSTLAYECANGLDTGEFSQSKAKDVVASIKSSLRGLLNSNASNCFTNNLNYLIAECEDKERGFLLSKDMRYLQIAIADVIIKADLY